MINSSSFLVFQIKDARFAIEAESIIEIIWLPELSPVSELSFPYVGVFNFRGEVVPVLDLNLKLLGKTYSYKLSNKLIVVKVNNKKVALHISNAEEVINPEESEMEKSENENGVVPYLIKHKDDIIQKINLENLFKEDPNKVIKKNIVLEKLFGKINHNEKEILVKRKLSYQKFTDKTQESLGEKSSIAIIKIGEEFFGINLKFIQEFSDTGSLAPVPCTPRHIAGCMNLRGDILTLLDMDYILFGKESDNPESGKVVIVRDSTNLGILVKELLDVIYIDENFLTPSQSHEKEQDKSLVKETYFHSGKTIGMLDMEKLLNRDDLIVNDSILS